MTADRSTPGPWTWSETDDGTVILESAAGQVIRTNRDCPPREADALLIIRAVNTHEAMREALAALLIEAEDMNRDLRMTGKGRPNDGAHPDCPIEMARAALALAEKD